MNSQEITDETFEILRRVQAGEEWEYSNNEIMWGNPESSDMNIFMCLGRGYRIRFRPFVPEPPEGYRLLTKEECKGQWIKDGKYWGYEGEGRYFWTSRQNPWDEGTGCQAVKVDHIAVPLEHPSPEYVPWTFETFPKDRPVWLRPKEGNHTDTLGLVLNVRPHGATVADHSFCVWKSLLDRWLQHTGEPCGTIKQ